MATNTNRFSKGSGCFTCRACKKQTRSTGHNGSIHLCPLCFERTALENTLVDNGWGDFGSLAKCNTVAECEDEFARLKYAAESTN